MDISKGIAYYQKAADMGYAQAYYNLAECYKDGTGLKRNYVKALAYYLAADNALQDIR
jgi:TPR repeat protein